MTTDLDVVIEHWERYRAVTLQFVDLVPEEELHWRPDAESFAYGEHLLHIAQTEDFYRHGLFANAWNQDLIRFPNELPDRAGLTAYFTEVRGHMLPELRNRSDADLANLCDVPHAPHKLPLRWWLWFILEHEIHPKAQLAVYARMMGHTPPYYAMPLPIGTRPDIDVRDSLS